MLGYRALVIQKELRKFDEKLFLNKNFKGELQIMRKPDHYICSLTEDWTSKTEPVDWGLLPILEHLKSIDAQNKDSLVNQLEEMHLKADESKKRKFKNQTEDYCRYELRDRFKKATDDVLTSNLEKIDSRRKRDQKWQS